MGESRRRTLLGSKNPHSMKALKRTEHVLEFKARNPETPEARSIRAMHLYLNGEGSPAFREALGRHYDEVHPSHTERVSNCALCELESRAGEQLGVSVLPPIRGIVPTPPSATDTAS